MKNKQEMEPKEGILGSEEEYRDLLSYAFPDDPALVWTLAERASEQRVPLGLLREQPVSKMVSAILHLDGEGEKVARRKQGRFALAGHEPEWEEEDTPESVLAEICTLYENAIALFAKVDEENSRIRSLESEAARRKDERQAFWDEGIALVAWASKVTRMYLRHEGRKPDRTFGRLMPSGTATQAGEKDK